VYRKWQRFYQNEGFLPVFDPPKGGFLSQFVPLEEIDIVMSEINQ
jgi:hypothetical protein